MTLPIYDDIPCYNKITKLVITIIRKGGIMMELLSIVALFSLYKFLDTPSEAKEAGTEDYYMDESEYCD